MKQNSLTVSNLISAIKQYKDKFNRYPRRLLCTESDRKNLFDLLKTKQTQYIVFSSDSFEEAWFTDFILCDNNKEDIDIRIVLNYTLSWTLIW